MTANNQYTYEIYDITDPQKQNIDRVLAFALPGTQLRDCFGSGFIVVDGNEEPRRVQQPAAERGGPRFV